MTTGDLAAVDAVAAEVHPFYPEDASIPAERLELYPDGCRVLDAAHRDDMGDAIGGYVVSHPWHLGKPPALNVLIGRLPARASTYYIHDLALLPEARGTGAAGTIVRQLLRHAAESGLGTVSLIAVNDSVRFWRRYGFDIVDLPEMRPTLSSYDKRARLMMCDVAT
ncbi:MAG: GNAT family N-acetyltransferase [Bradyrhizobium sp.]